MKRVGGRLVSSISGTAFLYLIFPHFSVQLPSMTSNPVNPTAVVPPKREIDTGIY